MSVEEELAYLNQFLGAVSLEQFLGEQYVTHFYKGFDGILGIDGELYRFVRKYEPCPNRGKDGHWHRCSVERLGHVRRLSTDEVHSIELVTERPLRAIDHPQMVTFRRVGDALVGRDERFDAETCGRVLFVLGTVEVDDRHTRFAFTYEPGGYNEAALRKLGLAGA